ncbi:MAG: thiamine/thiamine pyrophosphate ABC transporter permease ThiP [Rhodobacteraceae bacterium]|nr:thiamine/thiamine pyrophosphate ABC transporter permease ThiP [Paracoccaceae bacterium]
MAKRLGPIGPALIGFAVVALTLGSAMMTAVQKPDWAFGPADVLALRFTLLQASLSAVISCALAVPLARALARRHFLGRTLLIRLMAAPFLLPVVVAILGLLAVFGRAGPVNQIITAIGVQPMSIFGLHGVVLAHVFLNLPLATRMLLQGWQSIPAERFRLAVTLDMPPSAQFRHLEIPMLRSHLPGALSIVFLLCLTSFAVALTLGGGPGASTLELAIYQALRFEFDLGHAAALALVQFALCFVVALVALRFDENPKFGAGLGREPAIPAPGGLRKILDGLMIFCAAAFLLTPLAAVILRGLPGLGSLPPGLAEALVRSVLIAVASALLAISAALSLAMTVARGTRWLEPVAMLPLAASGLVMGTGLFLAIHPILPPERLALLVTLLVNATMALPFLFRLLLPEARALLADYGRLSDSLGLSGAARLRLVTIPRLARPLGFGAGLAAALSMGDLGVIALFAGERSVTLPLLVQRLMGAYRMEAAAGAALVLVAASFALFWLFDRWGTRHAAA